MEKELSCSNYGMIMEMSNEQIANCYFHPNWENSMDQNDPFESALSSMVSSPTSTTPHQPPPSSNGGMMIKELIGRLGSICDNDGSGGEISPQKSSIVNNSTNTSCYSTPLNSPPPSRFNLSSIMMMGNNLNNPSVNYSNYPPNDNHLGSFNADPGFVERAAKFPCFGNNNNNNNNNVRDFDNVNVNANHHVNGNYNGRLVGKLENNGKLSRVNSGKKIMGGRVSRGSSPEINGELGDSREGSSVSEQNPVVDLPIKVQNVAQVSRKRKSVSKAKVKDTPIPLPAKDDKVNGENEESDAKRSKVNNEEAKKENTGEFNSSCNKEKQNNNNNNNNNSNNCKDAEKPEPPKDYIHVRARRGQATDSHSLAERVRREKISERMKFLQDLVPGCNKVTGKATVLDEIINYVQSLQRQVEFLSMKLSTVNPRMEFNLEALLSSKDMLQPRGNSVPETMYPLDQNAAHAFPYGYQSNQQMPMQLPNGVLSGIESPFSVNPANVAGIRRNLSVSLPSVDGFTDSMNQLPTLWEDDLHSIVQMGIAQNQSQSIPGSMPNAQMKTEQ